MGSYCLQIFGARCVSFSCRLDMSYTPFLRFCSLWLLWGEGSQISVERGWWYHRISKCWDKTSSVQFSSVPQSCLTLCDPKNDSTPGLHVHHQLPEFTQTHVHWVGDAIQPSHPLLSPSPTSVNLYQHQGLFKSVSSLHQVAKVLEFQLQHQYFQWRPRTDLL